MPLSKSKIERARARKAKFLALEKQVKELESRQTPTPQRRSSQSKGIGGFLREMLVDESRVRPKSLVAEVVAPRRGSTSAAAPVISAADLAAIGVNYEGMEEEIAKQKEMLRVLKARKLIRRGSIPIVNPKTGKVVAELPVQHKTTRVPEPFATGAASNQSAFAKALRARRAAQGLSHKDDVVDKSLLVPPKYAVDSDGVVKEKCTAFQKFFNLKCDKVKLTPEERELAWERMKADAAAFSGITTQKKKFRVDGRNIEELTPGELLAAQREAEDEEMEAIVGDRQARLREELERIRLGKHRKSDAEIRAAIEAKKARDAAALAGPADKFAGIPIVDKVDPTMAPGATPVLGKEISKVNGQRIRYRFVAPAAGDNLDGLPVVNEIDVTMAPGSKPKCNKLHSLDAYGNKFLRCKVAPPAPAAARGWWPFG